LIAKDLHGFGERLRVLMVDLSHSFEMTVGWFEMTVGWLEMTVGWFEMTVGWFEMTEGSVIPTQSLYCPPDRAQR